MSQIQLYEDIDDINISDLPYTIDNAQILLEDIIIMNLRYIGYCYMDDSFNLWSSSTFNGLDPTQKVLILERESERSTCADLRERRLTFSIKPLLDELRILNPEGGEVIILLPNKRFDETEVFKFEVLY